MVSPRPSCRSVWLSAIVWPPSWRMATSNDTRVRVDGFSKIIASTASAMPFGRSVGRHALAGLLHGVRHVDDARAASWRRARRDRGSAGRRCVAMAMALRPAERKTGFKLAGGTRRGRARATDAATASAISSSATLSGGSRRTTLSPAPTTQQLLGERGLDHVSRQAASA